MNKEEILERLKDSVLTILRKGKEFRENPPLFQKWQENYHKLENGIKSLNSCDCLWVNDEYGKWFKEHEEIQTRIQNSKIILDAFQGLF